jgi:hypothetical protein
MVILSGRSDSLTPSSDGPGVDRLSVRSDAERNPRSVSRYEAISHGRRPVVSPVGPLDQALVALELGQYKTQLSLRSASSALVIGDKWT